MVTAAPAGNLPRIGKILSTHSSVSLITIWSSFLSLLLPFQVADGGEGGGSISMSVSPASDSQYSSVFAVIVGVAFLRSTGFAAAAAVFTFPAWRRI